MSARSSRVRAISASSSAISGVAVAAVGFSVSGPADGPAVFSSMVGHSCVSGRRVGGPIGVVVGMADGVDVPLEVLHGHGRDRRCGLLDTLLAQQRCDTGSDEQHDGDDEGREPGVHRQGEREDGGGEENSHAVQGEQARGAEHAGPDAGLLRLAAHLELGKPELVAHQLGDLAGQPRDQLAGRVTADGRPGDRAVALRVGGLAHDDFALWAPVSQRPSWSSTGWSRRLRRTGRDTRAGAVAADLAP